MVREINIGDNIKKKVNPEKEKDFGIYLGIDPQGKYLVGIKNWEGLIIGYQKYDTRDQFLAVWIID